MKKILAIILTVIILAGVLAGCGDKPQTEQITAQASTDKYRSFYQIWISAFCDTNGDETGDIPGIISKLDYLNDGDPNAGDDLGIDGIWLSPMMPSKSYHKYNVRDYFAIDEDFGTLDDLDELIEACHKRGIKVIIDLVLNHSGSDHEFFVKACEELREGKEDGYARYYHFSKNQDGRFNHSIYDCDYYYEGPFSEDMPDWNLNFEGTREYFEEVTKFWFDHGVDGFRLDAIKYFEDQETDGVEFLKWFYEMAQSYKPDVYMVGEDWDGAASIYEFYESGIDSLFNFKFATSSGEFANGGRSGLVEDLLKALKKYDDNIKTHNKSAINANFLTNHDMARLANALDEDENKFAAALYMLAPGNTFTYYGEEIGIEAASTSSDAFYRTAMIWDNDELPDIYVPGVSGVEENWLGGVKQQLEQEDSLLNTYRALYKLRLQNPEIARGNIAEVVSFGDKKCAGIVIDCDGSKLLIVHNGNKEDTTVSVDAIDNPVMRGYVVAGIGDSESENATATEPKLNGKELTLPARASVVMKAG